MTSHTLETKDINLFCSETGYQFTIGIPVGFIDYLGLERKTYNKGEVQISTAFSDKYGKYLYIYVPSNQQEEQAILKAKATEKQKEAI